jgi:hypothetical protein
VTKYAGEIQIPNEDDVPEDEFIQLFKGEADDYTYDEYEFGGEYITLYFKNKKDLKKYIKKLETEGMKLDKNFFVDA